MERTEENAIEELCKQQKGNSNQSPPPLRNIETGLGHQSGKRCA